MGWGGGDYYFIGMGSGVACNWGCNTLVGLLITIHL